MSDAVYRQSVIEILHKRARDTSTHDYEHQRYLKALHDVWNDIEQMPSAQPDIIHCRDCKHWQSEEHIGNNNVHTLNLASLPCKNWLTAGDWYCGSAERRTDDTD